MVRVVFSYGPTSPHLWAELSGYQFLNRGPLKRVMFFHIIWLNFDSLFRSDMPV